MLARYLSAAVQKPTVLINSCTSPTSSCREFGNSLISTFKMASINYHQSSDGQMYAEPEELEGVIKNKKQYKNIVIVGDELIKALEIIKELNFSEIDAIYIVMNVNQSMDFAKLNTQIINQELYQQLASKCQVIALPTLPADVSHNLKTTVINPFEESKESNSSEVKHDSKEEKVSEIFPPGTTGDNFVDDCCSYILSANTGSSSLNSSETLSSVTSLTESKESNDSQFGSVLSQSTSSLFAPVRVVSRSFSSASNSSDYYSENDSSGQDEQMDENGKEGSEFVYGSYGS